MARSSSPCTSCSTKSTTRWWSTWTCWRSASFSSAGPPRAPRGSWPSARSCPSIRSRSRPAKSMCGPCHPRCPTSGSASAGLSTRRRIWATWTRRTSARRSRAAPTSGCGSSNRTPRGPCGRTSRADHAVKLGRAAVGLPHDFVDRRGEELVAEHHRVSIHEHIAHVTRARRVYHERYRVAHRRVEVRLAQVGGAQVGSLARGHRANLGFAAERPGAPERGELEHPTGGGRVGAEPWLLDPGAPAPPLATWDPESTR